MRTSFPFFFFFFWPPLGAYGILFSRPGIKPGLSTVESTESYHWTAIPNFFFSVYYNSGILIWSLSEPLPSLLNLFFFFNACFFRLIAKGLGITGWDEHTGRDELWPIVTCPRHHPLTWSRYQHLPMCPAPTLAPALSLPNTEARGRCWKLSWIKSLSEIPAMESFTSRVIPEVIVTTFKALEQSCNFHISDMWGG